VRIPIKLLAPVAASVLCLFGCAGGGSRNVPIIPLPQSGQESTSFSNLLINQGAQPSIGTGVIAVAENLGSKVNIYRQRDLQLVGTITKGLQGYNPTGVAFDASGDLFVAIQVPQASGHVLFYPAGSNSPTFTYTADLSEVTGLRDRSDGTIYVSNSGLSQSDKGRVVEFHTGKKTPFLIVYVPALPTGPSSVAGVGIDASKNMYVPYIEDNEHSHVEKFAPGSKHGTDMGIDAWGGISGITFDSAGNMLVGEYINFVGAGVYVYPPGSKNPSKIIGPKRLTSPADLALTADEKHLFVTDIGSIRGQEVVDEFSYPAGVFLRQAPGNNLIWGVAANPPAPH
jgi:hypothetical protein